MVRAKTRFEASCFRRKGHDILASDAEKEMTTAPKTGPFAIVHDMIEKHTVHEVEPTTSLTLSGEGRTEISVIVKEITFSFSVYDNELKTFGREARA